MYCYILPVSQISKQHILQLLLVRSNCLPCFDFISTEIRDDGRKCGYEFVASGRKTEPCFEVVAGVEVMAQRAKSLLDGPGGVEDRYMGTVDLNLESTSRPPKSCRQSSGCITDFVP